MRTTCILLISILIIALNGCKKGDDPPAVHEPSLSDQAELFLFLKSGESIYSDVEGNKYLSLTFNPDTLQHVYSILFEKDKKYNLSIKGNYCSPVDFLLLNPERDTLFHGEQGNIGNSRKYIVWQSTITDTLFLLIRYTEDINFHTYQYQVTFEEISVHALNWKGLSFECSGDWLIDQQDHLALVCHNSSYSKWARIVDNSLFNYDLEFKVGLKSGIPDIYTGTAFYANEELFEMVNLPSRCYEFKIIGPSTWEQWTWNQGVGRDWGETSTSLNRGEGAWNEMKMEILNDSIWLGVNGETVKSFKNISFMNNGLLLVVDDQKEDTVFFKDFVLNKR